MILRPLALATLIAITAPAQAALIQFDLTGTIDNSIDGSSIGGGAAFAASFVLDTNAPVTTPGAASNTYETPYTDITFLIDGITPTTVPSGTENLARALNDNQLDIYFNFDVDSAPFFGGSAGATFAQFYLQFFSAGVPMYSSTADLSTLDPTVLAGLTPAWAYLSAGPANLSDISLQVGITVLPETVPEPGTLSLLALGLLGGFGAVRRKRA